MPTLYQYTDSGRGYYLRSNIDGTFITLQLTPAAEGLLTDLGYGDGDRISWTLLKPLSNAGHLYTEGGGKQIDEQSIQDSQVLESVPVSEADKKRLREFLERSGPDEPEPEPGEDDIPVQEHLDEEVRSYLQAWTPTDGDYEAQLNRIATAANTGAIVRSIREHATDHPMEPDRFRASSAGRPIYTFETGGVPWAVYDFRASGSKTKIYVEIQPGTSNSQSLTFEQQITEWHSDSSKFTREQIIDLVTVFPHIRYYIKHTLQTAPATSIREKATAEIPESMVESVSDCEQVDTASIASEREVAIITDLVDAGFLLRTHRGRTVCIEEQQCTRFGELDVGSLVTVRIETSGEEGGTTEIQDVVGEYSVKTFLRGWDQWADLSAKEVKQRLNRTDSDRPVITLTDGDTDVESVQVSLSPLDVYLLQNTEIVNSSSIETAIREVLKQLIDGEAPSESAPTTHIEVDVHISSELYSLINAILQNTSTVETYSQLIRAALLHELSVDSESDETISFELTGPEVIALQSLSREASGGMDEHAKELVRSALEQEVRQIVDR